MTIKNLTLEHIRIEFQELRNLFQSALPFIEYLTKNPTVENLEMKEKILTRFNEETELIQNMYINYFNGMNKNEMKEIFIQCDADALRYISKDLAEHREMFEICQAVKETLAERNLFL